MHDDWEFGAAGVLSLPSGRVLRGRGLRAGAPSGLDPEFGLYLLGRPPATMAWESRWVRWPDFWLPTDRNAARKALVQAWQHAELERVEIACEGGRGRTGTAIACIAVLDGVRADQAVSWVRRHYHPGAIETFWQKRFVAHFLDS